MSFQNDTFSLNFNDLYEKHVDRRVRLYRYKIKNYDDTLRKILVHPHRNVMLLLEDETEVKAVLNTYQGNKTVISISSGQAAGASEGVNSETITLLSADLLPYDYQNEMYVYTLDPVIEKQLSLEDVYLDQLGASTLPKLQKTLYKDSKDEQKKVTNVLTLNKLTLKAPATNYKVYSYHDNDIAYFDGNESITLELSGLLGEFGSTYLDDSKHIRQAEYVLQENDTHKYALIQGAPTRLKPELVLSSDTYDEDKNLRFELARLFIGKQLVLRNLWSEFNFKTTGSDAAGQLYHAFLSIVFSANQRVTEFKDFRITDTSSPNLGKVDTSTLRDSLYGVAVDDILNIDQKEFSSRILKTWEQRHADLLKDETTPLNALYQAVKGVLAGLTEYIPSPYSFGNYQKIGRLALEWYFVPETMNITIAQVKGRTDFKVQLQSVKYEFDEKTKQISGLKEEYRKVSSVRTFSLDGKITLPSIPETFSEENKVSTAGTVDISNNNFLKYTWIFQLKDQSKYASLFQTNNPFIIQGETPNQHTVTLGQPGFTSETGTFTEATKSGLEAYIKDNFMLATREIKPGSGKVVVSERSYLAITGSTPGPYNGIDRPTYTKQYEWTYKFTWIEIPLPTLSATPIKPPYSIDQSQWETFESALGSNLSEYILKPTFLEKTGATRKLSDIYWKSTLANYAKITLTAVKKDGTKEKLNLTFEQGFKRDQSLVQEGVYV